MKICILGSGKVGTHLASAFYNKGHILTQVFSRSIEKAQGLSEMVAAEPINQVSSIKKGADLYLLCIPDDAIATFVGQLAIHLPQDSMVAHTAGHVASSVFEPFFEKYGVFYPLQSFVSGRTINMSEVPICITAKKKEPLNLLLGLSKDLSKNVHVMNDSTRLKLHIPAVFINNFTNYLFGLAKGYCQKEGLPFSVLNALMIETVDRMINGEDPSLMQTGPAVRGDRQTMISHIQRLSGYPEMKKTYKFLSNMIKNSYSV